MLFALLPLPLPLPPPLLPILLLLLLLRLALFTLLLPVKEDGFEGDENVICSSFFDRDESSEPVGLPRLRLLLPPQLPLTGESFGFLVTTVEFIFKERSGFSCIT